MIDLPKVLHDGEDFVLHYHPGSADYLLVTFVATHQEGVATTDYLLRDFAVANDITCLGIACKTRNFYVSGEIERVLELAAPITTRFKTVVVVGNSVGGYGALKFSRRLNATHVLAMAPPLTLDPEDPVFQDPAEQARLRRNLSHVSAIASFDQFRGMAIRPQDVSGRIFVLHNPFSAIDAYQMKHLRSVIAVEEGLLPRKGHDIFNSISQSATMLRIIDLLRTARAGMLRQEFRAIKRTTPGCVAPMLQQAVARHPLLVHRALRGKQITTTPALRELARGRLSIQVAYHLGASGRKSVAVDRIDDLLRERVSKSISLAADQDADGINDLQPGRRYLLLSIHGTFLSVANAGSTLVLSGDPFTKDGIKPAFASVSPDGLVLQTVSRDGEPSKPVVVNGEASRLEWARSGGCITLKTPSGFITGIWNDTLNYGDATPNDCTQFLPIAVADPTVLIPRRANDWLEAASTRATDTASAPARPTTQPAQSSGFNWSKLFKFGARAQ